ncbi:MAG: hypothetical protein U0636_10415 [Phycisphaerales bacterium]
MNELVQALAVVPAVVFPLASVVQLVVLIKAGNSRGVSVLTWSMFAFANVCLFVYMPNRWEPQALATTLGTATVQVVIVALAVHWRRREKRDGQRASAGDATRSN